MKTPVSIIALIAFCFVFCYLVYPIQHDPIFTDWINLENESPPPPALSEAPPFVPATPPPPGDPARGEYLFKNNCASCHSTRLERDLTGPALFGVMDRVPSREWVYPFIRNSYEVIESGDPYANQLYENWDRVQMTAMPFLTDQDIDDLLFYIERYN